MTLDRLTARSYLESELRFDDKKHIEWLTDISLLLFIIHEFSFQCPLVKNAEIKPIFIGMLAPETIVAYEYKPTFPEERPPGPDDFAQARRLYAALLRRSNTEQQNLLTKLINEKWDAGQRQHRIYTMEMEGSVMSEVGIVTATAMGILTFNNLAALRRPMPETTSA
jgi:hypothetical protein